MRNLTLEEFLLLILFSVLIGLLFGCLTYMTGNPFVYFSIGILTALGVNRIVK